MGRIVKVMIITLGVAVIVSQLLILLVLTLPLRFHNPDQTAFMKADPNGAVYSWVDLDNTSRNLEIAIVVHEDDQFPSRFGAFDVGKFAARIAAFRQGVKDPSGSTLDQQLVKNIWLSSTHSWFRKGVEADYATILSLSVSKARRLELYINAAQFSSGLYGICAASWYYFNEAPAELTIDQSAQLVGVLPNPNKFVRAPGGGVRYHQGNGTIKDMGDSVAYARAHLPKEIRNNGGLKVTESLGITGFAITHVGGVKCDTMPAGVLAKIIQVTPVVPLLASPVASTSAIPITVTESRYQPDPRKRHFDVSHLPYKSKPPARAPGVSANLVMFTWEGHWYYVSKAAGTTPFWDVSSTGGKGAPAAIPTPGLLVNGVDGSSLLP